MPSRIPALLLLLVPLAALAAAIGWIGPRAVWREAALGSAPSELADADEVRTSVWALDSAPDGKSVLACLRIEGKAVPLWIRLDEGRARPLPAARSLVAGDVFWKATLHPDGESLLLAGPRAGVSRVWLETGRNLLLRKARESVPVTALAIAPDGRTCAVAVGEMIVVSDTDDGHELLQLQAPGGSVMDMVFSPDGRRLAAARGAGALQAWNLDTGALCRTIGRHSQPVSAVRFAGGGRHLAAAGLDGTFRVWDAETGELLWSASADASGLRAMDVSPDGVWAVAGGFDGVIHVYDLADRREVKSLDEHSRAITALRFSADGSLLVSAASGGTLCFRNVAADFTLRECIDVDSIPR